MEPPTITEFDLLRFHADHFEQQPLELFTKAYLPDSIPSAKTAIPETTTGLNFFAEEEVDELGFYDDGVKRTLTAEQVAMFRHSEIHALQRQRRLARENHSDDDDDAEEAEVRPPRRGARKTGGRSKQAAAMSSDAMSLDRAAEEEELEYAAFLERERNELLERERDLDYDDLVQPVQDVHEGPEPDLMAGRRRVYYGDDDEDAAGTDAGARLSTARDLPVQREQKREFLWPKIGG